jgi:hypothetical protein
MLKIEYRIEYTTFPGPKSFIDGTNVNDLHGWPTERSEIIHADSDGLAEQFFANWKGEFNKHIESGEYKLCCTRLLKIITIQLA